MWRHAAGCEADAVSSFLQLEAELASLGAPVALQEWAARAAHEEVGHARIATSIAARLLPDGTGAGLDAPAPSDFRVPRRRPARPAARQYRITRLAVESYLDGCCNEGAELRRLSLAAGRAAPDLAAELRAIAAEEASHAALAWAVVTWAVEQGGPQVAWVLAHLWMPEPSGVGVVRNAALERWGWVAAGEQVRCLLQSRAAARRRLLRSGAPPATVT